MHGKIHQYFKADFPKQIIWFCICAFAYIISTVWNVLSQVSLLEKFYWSLKTQFWGYLPQEVVSNIF